MVSKLSGLSALLLWQMSAGGTPPLPSSLDCSLSNPSCCFHVLEDHGVSSLCASWLTVWRSSCWLNGMCHFAVFFFLFCFLVVPQPWKPYLANVEISKTSFREQKQVVRNPKRPAAGLNALSKGVCDAGSRGLDNIVLEQSKWGLGVAGSTAPLCWHLQPGYTGKWYPAPEQSQVLGLGLDPLSGCSEGRGLLNGGGKASGPQVSTRHGGSSDPALGSCEVRTILQWNCSWWFDGFGLWFVIIWLVLSGLGQQMQRMRCPLRHCFGPVH